MSLKESEALKLWLQLDDVSDEKLRFLAKTDGDEEAAKWAFIREYSKLSQVDAVKEHTGGLAVYLKNWPHMESGPMTMTVVMVICLFIPPLFIVSIILFIWLMSARGGWPYLGAYIVHNLTSGLITFLISTFALDGFIGNASGFSNFAFYLFFVMACGVASYVGTFPLFYKGLFKLRSSESSYGLALLSLLIGYVSNLVWPISAFSNHLSVGLILGVVLPTTLIYGLGVYLMSVLKTLAWR